MVIERALSIDTIVIPCSRNRVEIFQNKIHLYKDLYKLSIWSVQLVLEDRFDFVMLFEALHVVQSSSRLAYLYIAAFIFSE